VAGRPVAGCEPAGAHAGLLFLTDADGGPPVGDPNWAVALAERGLRCAVAGPGPSWWSDRDCPAFAPARSAERWVLDSLVPFCLTRWGVGTLGLAGLGAGGQGALRLGFKHPNTFRVVAALDGAIDHHELYGRGTPLDDLYDSREWCRQDSATLHIHPSRQPPHLFFACDPASPWHRGNDRLHEKLAALGVPHTADLTTPRGTGVACLHFSASMILTFTADGLAREGRRLV
jgi:S-formylglutathione hydrolase